MKKMIALLMALAMVLSLCACGGGGSAPAGEAAASVAPVTSEAASGSAAATSAEASGSTVAEHEEAEAQKDLVAVESISAVKDGELVRLEAKIRNLTDEKKDRIEVDLQGLDSNGDIIDTYSLSIEDLQPGQASKVGSNYGTDRLPPDEVVTIRMNSYEFWERTGSNSFSNSQYYDCAEYIDYTMTKNGDEYQWLPADDSIGTSDADGEAKAAAAATETSSDSVFETDYVTIDGLYVSDGYKTKDDENARLLYVFYTVHSPEQNLKVDAKSMELTINDVNTYKSGNTREGIHFMRSYYSAIYLRDVKIGDSMKIVQTFTVPEADLAPGRKITIEKQQIPDINQILLSTDDIIHCKNIKEVAKKADPEGYKQEKHDLDDADSDRAALVRDSIVDYEFYVNADDMTYKLWFKSASKYELTTSGLGTVTGTYKVKNGYVVLKNDKNGGKVHIPYEVKDGKVDLKTIQGFSLGYHNIA